LADITDPTVWSTIVQTLVLTATLIIFILSFRSQDKAVKEQAYQTVMDDYGEMMRGLSEKPELYEFQRELFNRSRRPLAQSRKDITREELVIRNYVIGLYGFFERIYSLYRRKWIDEDTWKQWAAFLELVCAHPVFQEVHHLSTDMWDKPFVDYVDAILDRMHRSEQLTE
jgi:hypothetical protein